MIVTITGNDEIGYTAETGATEVHVRWPDRSEHATKSLGLRHSAPTMIEAVNGLANLYNAYMLRPHFRWMTGQI